MLAVEGEPGAVSIRGAPEHSVRAARASGRRPGGLASHEPHPPPPVHRLAQAAAKRRRRSEFVSTDTLDSDIAALARTGDSNQPVHRYSAPAATGIPITL